MLLPLECVLLFFIVEFVLTLQRSLAHPTRQ